MQNSDQKLLETHEPPLLESPEQKLRAEIESLKRELAEARQNKQQKNEHHPPRRPHKRTLRIAALALVALLLLAFFLGWLPHHRREARLQKEAAAEKSALPKVDFVWAQRSPPVHELLLPANIEAETDSPILARADGYMKRRYVDIGDRVKKGQLMAEVEAPDLDQQVRQARAQLMQAQASQQQSVAAYDQGKANEELARVSAVRWRNLVNLEAVSRQENDTYQANYQAQIANVHALAQAVSAARENVGAAEANLSRLAALQGFEQVRAPFDGVVTVRNIDTGALIGTGTTLLFRVAQIDRLRTYIYVPQSDVTTVQVGQTAELYSLEFGGRTFTGVIRRTASSLDPNTRTLLTEIAVPNPQRVLLPGMFVQVRVRNQRANPPILIPGESLIVRSQGTLVAVLRNYRRVPPEQMQQEDQQPQKINQKDKTGAAQQKTRNQGNDQQEQSASQGNAAGGKGPNNKGKPPEVVEGTVHLVPVTVGHDYGNATEIYSGLQDHEILISNPNDDVREGARVRATETNAELDQMIQSPGGKPVSTNSEQLQNTPGSEPTPKQPSVERKTRGPSH